MADFLFSPGLHLILFLCAAGFAVAVVRTQKLRWSIPAILCTIVGCLLGLAAGRAPEQLLTAVLIPTAIILRPQRGSKGGGDA